MAQHTPDRYQFDGKDAQRAAELLREHFGSIELASQACGVSRTTLVKVTQGQNVQRGKLRDVIRAAIEHLPPSRLSEIEVVRPPLWDTELPYEDARVRTPSVESSCLRIARDLPRVKTKVFQRELDSCFGVAASLWTSDSRWLRPFSVWGCDIFVMKTVRTCLREPLDDKRYVVYISDDPEGLTATDPDQFPTKFYASRDGHRSLRAGKPYALGNRIGVASREPAIWAQDVQRAVRLLGPNRVLVVSIIGTIRSTHGTPQQLREELVLDTVACARYILALDRDWPAAIEINLSCPNASVPEGLAFHDPALSGALVRSVREAINTSGRDIRLIAKIGYVESPDDLRKLCDAILPHIDAIAAINTRAAHVVFRHADGREVPAFGDPLAQAGISGRILKPSALRMIEALHQIITQSGRPCLLFGMGGVSSADDVLEFR